MSRDSSKSQHNSGVLNRIILIIQPCSHNSHIISHAVSQQFFQTIRINDLRVIVQQKQILAFCLLRAKIIDGGIVKRSIPVKHMRLRIFLFQFLIVFEGLLLRAVVFHNNILIILIGGLLLYGIHTPSQIFDVIFIRNDNGDQWIIISYKFCPVQSQIFSLKNLCLHADPVIMCLDSSLSRVKSITFALRILGSGLLMAPPVIENLRHMADLIRRFHTAEDKIIILRSIVFRP